VSSRRIWEPWELEFLHTTYPSVSTEELAQRLRRSVAAIYGRAALMGLHKSEEYLAGPHACRLRRGDDVGAACRFQRGHVPANKGLRRPGWSRGRMAETQFKPGARPHTWKPIGSTRLTRDGYLQRKISDTGYPPKDWVGVHILLWEEAHGPIPKGHALVFKDRNKSHICLDNLELITRRELMRRNTIHHYPPELADVIRLGATLKRKLRRMHEEQNVGSAQPLVRNAGSAQGSRAADGD
jgi:HNH endonuclease